MLVIDASAALRAFGADPAALSLRERIQSAVCHAPHLFDADIGQALRGLERAGRLDAGAAAIALRLLPELVDHRHPHRGRIADRGWALRHNLSFYDALYVALATQLEMPLLTSDRRLGRAPGLPCRVEIV